LFVRKNVGIWALSSGRNFWWWFCFFLEAFKLWQRRNWKCFEDR
jgi:hypothetical protein